MNPSTGGYHRYYILLVQVEVAVFFKMLYQTAVIEDLHHHRRQWRKREGLVFGQVRDGSGTKVDLKLIALLNTAGIDFQHRQAYIDGITEKYPGKRLCQHGADASELDDARRM